MTRPLRLLLVASLLLALAAFVWHLGRPLPSEAPQLLLHSDQDALHAAHAGQPGAARLLYQQLRRSDLPPEVRAQLYGPLPNYPSAPALAFAKADLKSPAPAVRYAATAALARMLDGEERAKALGPLLDDPDPSLRFQVASALMTMPAQALGTYTGRLSAVQDEFAQRLERAQNDEHAQLQLATLRLQQGHVGQALTAAQRALQLNPDSLRAKVAVAHALDRLGRSDEARETLAQPLRQGPDDAYLQHELGLWLLNHGQPEYALLALTKAVELAPDSAAYRMDLATSLHGLDQPDAAQAQLDQLVRRQPANRQARLLLIHYWKEAGQLQNVQILLAELEQQNPDDPILQQGL